MIINGDMERLDACARVAMGTLAGGADAGLVKAAKFFNIKMKEFARDGAFVTDHGRLWRVEGAEAIEAVTLEDAGKGSFGDGQGHEDLGVGPALAAEGEDLGFEVRRGFARLVSRHRGAILQTLRRAGLASAPEPFADGFFGDGESGGGSAERVAAGEMGANHFNSHERGECGISVHSVRVGWLAVASITTTHLLEPSRADNLLKHDT